MPRIEALREATSNAVLSSRAWYGATIAEFLRSAPDSVFAQLVSSSEFALLTTQKDAWLAQIDNQIYLRNAYRVLLTRAWQGMVIFIPQGEPADPTRSPDYYDTTFNYFTELGVPTLR